VCSANRKALQSHGKTQHSNYLERSDATSAVRKQTERPSIVHSSLYLPEPVYEALRRITFDERVKIHDSCWRDRCGAEATSIENIT
jgi:hypothetical protein